MSRQILNILPYFDKIFNGSQNYIYIITISNLILIIEIKNR